MPIFHYFHFYKNKNDGSGFGKARCPRFQTTICFIGVRCSVGFAHANDG